MRALPAVLLPLLLAAACSAPPQKEIDLAQGAIDAARAAGAEQYAGNEFTAATSALQQAHDAVGQRDYRLALTRALDAHDRAQAAAKGAADGKARARADAEVAASAAGLALEQLRTRLKALDADALAPRDLQAARRVVTTTDATLQEARAAVRAGDYLRASALAKGIPERMKAEIAALEAAAAKKPARPPRRRR